jgi:hypothetical protein
MAPSTSQPSAPPRARRRPGRPAFVAGAALALIASILVTRACGGGTIETPPRGLGPLEGLTAPGRPPAVRGGPGPWIDRYQGLSGRLAEDATPDDRAITRGTPSATTTPVFRSAQILRVAGDLVLDAEVRLDRAGTYWAYAELWAGPDGSRPIAFARRRFPHLGPGLHSIRLLFGGAVIREANADGPYRIRRLILNQVDGHPPREVGRGPQIQGDPSWRAQDFE